MSERVLVGGAEAAGQAPGLDVRTVWRMALFAGIVFAVVGWIDVALIWYPPAWASVDWEFGSISGTFDALPLSTIGLCLVLFSVVARGRVWGTRLAAILMLVIALFLTVCAVVLLLDVPVVLQAVQPQMKPLIKRAIVKALAIGVSYITLYGVFGVWSVRRARALAKRS